MSVAEHSDSFEKTKAPAEQTPAQQPANAPKAVNNEAQANLAEAERQREYTMGGGGTDTPTAAPAAVVTQRIDGVIARVKGGDRPSPYGTAYFPPLPAPPARR